MTGALLILGAGEDQLPLYHEARRRGLSVIAVDGRRERPARTLADLYLEVSTRDAAAVTAALGDVRPAAVVSAASDAGLLTWASLCETFTTPYRYPLRAARLSSDKAAFRRLSDDLGLPGYRWAVGGRAEELAQVRTPLITKPNDGSGSKGLSVVTHDDELRAAFEHAATHSPDGIVIAEELVPGRHLALEMFLGEGRPMFAAITEKRFVSGYLVGTHLCPADLAERVREELVEAGTRLCEAIGLRDGPVNFDAVLTPAGHTVLIEVNARLGGNGLPALLRAAHGVDVVAALISLALGEPVDLRPGSPPRHTALTMFGSPLPVAGTLTGVSGLTAARAVPGVVSVDVFALPGQTVRPFDQSGNKIGQILAAGSTADGAAATAREALTLIDLQAAPSLEREPDVRS